MHESYDRREIVWCLADSSWHSFMVSLDTPVAAVRIIAPSLPRRFRRPDGGACNGRGQRLQSQLRGTVLLTGAALATGFGRRRLCAAGIAPVHAHRRGFVLAVDPHLALIGQRAAAQGAGHRIGLIAGLGMAVA